MDTLSLMPQPDFLILADECNDYHHSFDLKDEFSSRGNTPRDNNEMEDEDGPRKFCEVVNPGNFSHDLSFLALYPCSTDEPIQLSKVPQ